MKFYLFIIILISVLGCNNDSISKEKLTLKEKELELKEKEILLREKEVNLENDLKALHQNKSEYVAQKYISNDTINNRKFLFIMIITYEPEIKEREIVVERGSKYSGGVIPDPVPEYEKYILPKYQKYYSDIIEVDNYNEDKKYQQIDKFEKFVRTSLQQINFNLYMTNNRGMAKPLDDIDAKIISKDAYIFDTYKAASLKRQ